MRSLGVPNFPDPNGQGNFSSFELAHGVTKQTARSAQTASEYLMKTGGDAGTPAQQAQKQQEGLRFAECIRSHGFPKYPDPTLSGRSLQTDVPGTGIDENSPQFRPHRTPAKRR